MTYDTIWRRLAEVYPANEAKAVTRYLLEVGFGFTSSDIYCDKVTQLSSDEKAKLCEMLDRLGRGEPVQYVTGLADFNGRQFVAAPGALIPRPETAELCSIIIAEGGGDILDIGTGSGCIAITLALELKSSRVEAWDISERALSVAGQNVSLHNADVALSKVDALNAPDDYEKWDVVVSNPPYICDKEKADMDANVLCYEPHSALFVPDSEPLLFYRAITLYAKKSLRHSGRLYFEINPLYVSELCGMMRQNGFVSVKAHDDMFGKKRFVSAVKK